MTCDPQEAAAILATLFSKRRVGTSIYMDGSHNPTPVDHAEARRFINDLIESGWKAPPETVTPD